MGKTMQDKSGLDIIGATLTNFEMTKSFQGLPFEGVLSKKTRYFNCDIRWWL